MNISKKLLATAVAASTMAFASVAPMANAEVSASVGIASTYLWRGEDLGSGTPAVWGDINYSASGFTAGAWVSSGDTTAGTEYDLYASYGGEVGDFSYSIMAITYVYPESTNGVEPSTVVEDLPDPADDRLLARFNPASTTHAGDLSEVIIGLGYGPVALTYYDNIAGANGYSYVTLGLSLGDFGFTYGAHDEGIDELQHFDISYAYNDNLAFTLSNVVDTESDAGGDSTFVVSYSLPIQ